MNRLLKNKNKKDIKEHYGNNPALRLITTAYKNFERKMEVFHISPEEMWLNVFISFDHIISDPENRQHYASTLWADIFCELRDELEDEGRNYRNEELDIATSCIVYPLIACLMATEDYDYAELAYPLMDQIAAHCNLNDFALPFATIVDNEFCEYIKGYVSKRVLISNTIDTLLMYGQNDDGRDEEKLIVTNHIFKPKMVYDGSTRIVSFTKLKLFLDEFFVQKCQYSYEWIVPFNYLLQKNILDNDDWDDFRNQMNEWFPQAPIKCPKSVRNYARIKNGDPETWENVKRTANLTDAVIINCTEKYRILNQNFKFPE